MKPPKPRKTKKNRPPAVIRSYLSENLVAFRDLRYSDLDTATARNKRLAKDADTTLSQIQRIIDCDLGTSIDLLEQLARALNAYPHELITPYARRDSMADALPSPRPIDATERRPTAR